MDHNLVVERKQDFGESCLPVSNKAVMEQLEKFWLIEQLPIKKQFSREEHIERYEEILKKRKQRIEKTENSWFVPFKNRGIEINKMF